MDLVQFLKKGMVWVQSDIEKQEDLFQMVAESGKSEGYVTDDFLTRPTDREQTFPTGLKLDGYGVALPHTDPECVTEQFIAVITVKDGIPFKLMEDAGQTVEANLIFVLGLNEPHSQLAVLQQLMGTIQDKDNVAALLRAKDEDEVKQILETITV